MNNQKRDDFVRNYRIPNDAPRYGVRYSTRNGTAKDYLRRVNESPEIIKKMAKRLGKKGVIISLASALVSYGITAVTYDYFEKKSNSIPIEEVIKNNEDMEHLGILPEDYHELEEIQNVIDNSEIQSTSLKEYRDRLEKLSLKIGKSKIASCMQDVDASRINFINNEATNLLPAWQAVVIRDKSTNYDNYDTNSIGYLDYACASLPDSKHKIDDKISSYISTIAWLHDLKNPKQEELKEAINKIKQFTCLEIRFRDGNFEINSDKIQESINKHKLEENER